ncbi:unnamed protein product [Microthlaspi erraticum]|uniref:Uncharacterized protein n=1 Tax=Microthlaspi erraticum TaxID=1685480 RepID=A0A6D2K4Y2_9BRAS|nr:unnamed protein product [Microthlaspi erraticum]
MSRKGVITKRVETVQTALSRSSAQTAQSGWPRNYVSRSAKVTSVRLKSRPKFQTDRPITQRDPGNIVPRSAKLQTSRHAAHDHAREPGNKPRGRATRSAYHGRCIRPSRERTSHVRPRNSSAKSSSAPTTPADRESVRPRPFRLGPRPDVRPIVPTDRPNAAVDPKPFLKPKLMFSSPA